MTIQNESEPKNRKPIEASPEDPDVAMIAGEVGEPQFSHLHLFENSRTKWQYGQWKELAKIAIEAIEENPDRAKLALLVGAAKSHIGDLASARVLVRQAAAWGCDRGLIARLMASMVHNSLGRLAASLDDDKAASQHFEAAISLVERRADAGLLGRTRRVHETARMGLLPDAAKLLGEELRTVCASPTDHAAQLAAMRTELDLLSNELSLALRRGQIMNLRVESGVIPSGLRSRAVSHLGQDLWVLEKTRYKRRGFFVEFGASDGVRLSNTWLLESDFEWTGICAEPNPDLFRQLQVNRRCAVSSACISGVSGREVEFILAGALGGIADFARADHDAERRDAFRRAGRVMRMTSVSLEDFLVAHDAPREIDYLSIDTEGSEFDILRHFPFDRWTVRLITIKHNRTPMRDSIRALLEPLGYAPTEAELDDWYALTGDDR